MFTTHCQRIVSGVKRSYENLTEGVPERFVKLKHCVFPHCIEHQVISLRHDYPCNCQVSMTGVHNEA